MVKADPTIPMASSKRLLRPSTLQSFGRCRFLRTSVTCRNGHLSPELLARSGLCCPARHHLVDLIRQSGELRVLSRYPVIDAVLDIQGSYHPVCPPHLPVFHR